MQTLFFWLSKIGWFFVSPSGLLFIALLVTLLLLRRQSYRRATRLLMAIVVAISLCIILPVGEWLLVPLERRFADRPPLPERVDGIIVLGGSVRPLHSSVWSQPELNEAADRELMFLTLMRRYPQAKLVYSGGSGSLRYQQYKEAAVAKQLFADLGVDNTRIVFEDRSRNTYENAVMSAALIKPAAGENWLLVSSAFHLPRAAGVFCRVGWPVIPYAADHRSLPGHLLRIGGEFDRQFHLLNLAVHEYLGLLVYRLSGKTDSLFPAGCDHGDV